MAELKQIDFYFLFIQKHFHFSCLFILVSLIMMTCGLSCGRGWLSSCPGSGTLPGYPQSRSEHAVE